MFTRNHKSLAIRRRVLFAFRLGHGEVPVETLVHSVFAREVVFAFRIPLLVIFADRTIGRIRAALAVVPSRIPSNVAPRFHPFVVNKASFRVIAVVIYSFPVPLRQDRPYHNLLGRVRSAFRFVHVFVAWVTPVCAEAENREL